MQFAKKAALIIFITIGFFVNSAYASKQGAEDFVSKTAESTLRIVSDSELSFDKKEEDLKKLFVDSIDINWIARFAMGLYWRDANDEQRAEYIELYKKFLISSYVPQFRTYTDQKIELMGVMAEDENEYLVQTEIKNSNRPNIRVDYKIRKDSSGKYQIFDIIAEGVSMITTQRSDFGSILSRKGVDHLIKLLREKVQG